MAAKKTTKQCTVIIPIDLAAWIDKTAEAETRSTSQQICHYLQQIRNGCLTLENKGDIARPAQI